MTSLNDIVKEAIEMEDKCSLDQALTYLAESNGYLGKFLQNDEFKLFEKSRMIHDVDSTEHLLKLKTALRKMLEAYEQLADVQDDLLNEVKYGSG